jgi:hypothetical protein
MQCLTLYREKRVVWLPSQSDATNIVKRGCGSFDFVAESILGIGLASDDIRLIVEKTKYTRMLGIIVLFGVFFCCPACPNNGMWVATKNPDIRCFR